MPGKWPARLAPPVLLLSILLVQLRPPAYMVGDTAGSIYVALSLYREGSTRIDRYAPALSATGTGARMVLDPRGGHVYGLFPLGASLFALPFVAGADLYHRVFHGRTFDSLARYRPADAMDLEVVVAATAVALTALLLHLLARRRLPVAWSLAFALFFAFGTSAWSVASRALWQHGPSMLALAASLYLLDRAGETPALAGWAALPLFFSYVVRPTNCLSVAALTAYVVAYHRDQLPRFAALAALVAVPFVLHNLSVYGAPLSPYYLPGRLGGSGASFGEALAGNLVSPARGLLVYTPVFALSLWVAAARLARGEGERLEPFLLAVVVLHWVAISSFPHWWGGWAYGPRFFSDMVPYLMFLLLPFLSSLAAGRIARPVPKGAALGVLALVSLLLHYRGATSPATHWWNGLPVSVDIRPERVWDWSDPPFLRRDPPPARRPREAGSRQDSLDGGAPFR